MDLVVRDGKVYRSGRLQTIDLFVKGGRIAAIGGPHRADEELDARGLLVLPGAVDIHVHFREPGATYKEDWTSGSTSAVAGGVTTVVDQPNTDPRTWDKRSFELKLDLASHGSVADFCINGGPGKIEVLASLGVAAIGEIFTYEHSPGELVEILRETEQVVALPTVHAEDGPIVERYTETVRGLDEPDAYSRARPPLAEAQAIDYALSATGRVHICHLSSQKGLEVIRAARAGAKGPVKDGAAQGGEAGIASGPLTCEVTPHHLIFNRRDYRKQGNFLKINPPLREPEDNNALWQALRSGEIDVIASDHAPHLPEEKRDDVWHAPPGVPGVETMLPLMLLAVKSNFVDLGRVVDALSTRPARILGLASKGEIALGKDADLVLVDPRSPTKIRADWLHSRADWTPYEGQYGLFPKMTLVRGKVVFDGDLAVRPGYGRFLPGAQNKIKP